MLSSGSPPPEHSRRRVAGSMPRPRRHSRIAQEKAPMAPATGALSWDKDDQSSSISGALSLVDVRPFVRKSTLSAMISQP